MSYLSLDAVRQAPSGQISGTGRAEENMGTTVATAATPAKANRAALPSASCTYQPISRRECPGDDTRG
jgi:hypothetical protein